MCDDYRRDFMLWGPCRCVSLCLLCVRCVCSFIVHSFIVCTPFWPGLLYTNHSAHPRAHVRPVLGRLYALSRCHARGFKRASVRHVSGPEQTYLPELARV